MILRPSTQKSCYWPINEKDAFHYKSFISGVSLPPGIYTAHTHPSFAAVNPSRYFVNCRELWEQVRFECLVLLIIYASWEKKIDPKHPGEANPCCLCDQLRDKLNVRNEWKHIVEKSCTNPLQARRCRAGEGCQRQEHGVLWSLVMETRMWEKILQQKVVKSS